MSVTAFVRVKNEEETLMLSLVSISSFVDKILVIFNNCTDKSEEIVDFLISKRYPIEKQFYPVPVAQWGENYPQQIQANPESSLAKYYNWCLTHVKTTHALKWDGDMVAIFSKMPDLFSYSEICDELWFDGEDVLGLEPIFGEDRRHFKKYHLLKFTKPEVMV